MPDKLKIQPQELREHADPEESIRPMPWLVALIAVGMVLFGIVYLLVNPPIERTDLGDMRSLADLRPGTQAAAGGAGGAIDGAAVFAANCAACHQANGEGLPGVFPPLAGSEWVVGEPKVLANILLHGIVGEIAVKGQTYAGMMPPFPQLSDAEIAAVLTHIRSTWGNQAEAIATDLVATEREAGSARTAPFEGGEALKALLK
ncbi:Uncharacterised protein [uncultured Comamonas sp.]|nr:Uncharacterised protein [uncultured Comamonas sp.]